MDPNAASGPGLISSLESMIQASVNSVIDRRLGPAPDILNQQIQAAVSAALEKRLGPAVGSLGNRMTSLIEQRLGNAVTIVNNRVNASLTAALEQRLGPAGGALTAQITFPAAPVPVSPSITPAKAEMLGEVKEIKGDNRAYPSKEEPANTRPVLNAGSEKNEQPTNKQKEIELKTSKMPTPESSDELSVPKATSEKSNEPASRQTGTVHLSGPNSAVYPLFADSVSKSKTVSNEALTGKPSLLSQRPSSSADRTLTKRKANQNDAANKADDPCESHSSSSEEESEADEPREKRRKLKLVPPGYTNGPAIKFRRVSPKLTASIKNRGFPRVVDLKSFSEASNKENFTMADVVATLLFNYDPLSLDAFIDMHNYPTFHFVRKENDRKAGNFVIERQRESYGVVVKVNSIQLILG